jgi:predicted  nucleic acid-binding Zn-ribbon protein
MPEERDEISEIPILMQQINKNLEGIAEFRKKLSETLAAVSKKMEALEKKIEGLERGGGKIDMTPIENKQKELEKEIEMIEATIENLDKNTKEHTHKDLQESIQKVDKFTKEDNKFIEAMHNELKSHSKDTEIKLREMDRMFAARDTETMQIQDGFAKSIDNIEQEIQQTSKFRNAFKAFIKAVLEEE